MHSNMKQLTAQKKLDLLPLLIEQQGGFFCLYCKQHFPSYKDLIYEHLNNKRPDNRMENLALAHQACNIKKNTFIDYQIIATEQLQKNESRFYLREKNITGLENKGVIDVSTEISINENNYEIVEQFIHERVSTDGSIPFQEALDTCVYLCKNRTNHGSHQCVRNYLNTLTCAVAPFMKISDERTKKKVIVKRVGN